MPYGWIGVNIRLSGRGRRCEPLSEYFTFQARKLTIESYFSNTTASVAFPRTLDGSYSRSTGVLDHNPG